MKTLVIIAALLFAPLANAAGDCSALVSDLQAAHTWRDTGMPRSEVPRAIARTMASTNAIRAASDEERAQWNELAIEIFDGRRFTDKQLEHAVGRFCKYPFKLTLDQATQEMEHRQGQKEAERARNAPIDPQVLYPNMSDAEAKQTSCLNLGIMFNQAAGFRNSGASPQWAYNNVVLGIRGGKFSITSAEAKRIVNLVYFDPAFTYAGGLALQQQVMDSCMRDGKPEFQPLQ